MSSNLTRKKNPKSIRKKKQFRTKTFVLLALHIILDKNQGSSISKILQPKTVEEETRVSQASHHP
jgi:hypothetical protein